MNSAIKGKYFCLFLLVLACSCKPQHSVSVIHSKEKPIAEKEAILILTGLGTFKFGMGPQKKYFGGKGIDYDVFIPKYIGRRSIKQCVTTLEEFIKKKKLGEYKKVHVFSYIIGSWVLNEYIKTHPLNNIASIVYDRSPLQERAPYVVIKDNVLFIKIATGHLIRDLADAPYPPIDKKNIKVGLLIESKATHFIREHKRTELSLGAIQWNADSLKQNYDDHTYTILDHDEMYKRFDIIGNEIFTFFKEGKFSYDAQRKPFTWDPFVKFVDPEKLKVRY